LYADADVGVISPESLSIAIANHHGRGDVILPRDLECALPRHAFTVVWNLILEHAMPSFRTWTLFANGDFAAIALPGLLRHRDHGVAIPTLKSHAVSSSTPFPALDDHVAMVKCKADATWLDEVEGECGS